VNWTEPEYPQSLLQIYDPPVALYVRGDASILDAATLAIVGTRRPTVYVIRLRRISPIRNRIIAGMPIGVIIVEGKQYSGSLITARLAMEFGREVSGVPGNVTQDVSFAPNPLIKQGAKLVTNPKDLIEELPTPVRAALVQLEAVESEQRNLLVADGLTPTEKKIYEPLSAEESRPI
jgi:predicted Rossmann fold nucleotide-binding protein DprA/Smf involved in DNA uptake